MLQHYPWLTGKPYEKAVKKIPFYQKKMDDFVAKVISENPEIGEVEAKIQFLLFLSIENDTIQWGQHELTEWKRDNLPGGKFDFERYDEE